MASSSRNDHDSDHDHILRPRPMKPGNPMVLRAMSEDRESGLKPNGGADSHMPSGISRYGNSSFTVHCSTRKFTKNPVADQPPFPQMPFHPSSQSHPPESKYVPKTSTGCFRQSITALVSRISTREAITRTSGASLCFSGLD